MSRKRPIKKCVECGEMAPHHARGLCSKCYERFRYYKKVADKKLPQRRKSDINTAFFKAWGPEMAYVFGFICADGYINQALTQLVIYNTDYNILDKIRNTMSYDHEIACYEKTKVYRLNVSKKEIVEDLVDFGLVPAKSLTLRFPDVPEIYVSNYIRGYFDGNGTINFHDKGSKPQITVGISTGSQCFAEGLLEGVKNTEGIRGSIHVNKNQKNDSYSINFYGYNAVHFLVWIYWNANGLFLERKHETTKSFLSKYI